LLCFQGADFRPFAFFCRPDPQAAIKLAAFVAATAKAFPIFELDVTPFAALFAFIEPAPTHCLTVRSGPQRSTASLSRPVKDRSSQTAKIGQVEARRQPK